ncbi:MAG TPA: hypothetical protein VL069_13200, partial [Opitutus sp.]|nr:hypothetical protein [Opitutus sp.]
MEITSGQEQWTHEEVVSAARDGLLTELELEQTELGQAFLDSPIGPRVRAGGVRASLARFAADRLGAAVTGVRFGTFLDVSDEVVLHLPAEIDVRENLQIPVLSSVSVKLGRFVNDVATRGAAAVATTLGTRKPTGLGELAERLRISPPTYEGWEQLNNIDIARAFRPNPPLLSDRKELYQRLRLACTYAVDRA